MRKDHKKNSLSIIQDIVDYIKTNRVSSTEVSDCLNKSGAIESLFPLNRGHFCVGPVFWTYGWNESNWSIHEQIQTVPENSVVVISDINCNGRALIGDIVSKYLMLYRKSAAIVVQGSVRDAPRLIKENWPIWANKTNPVGCFNQRPLEPLGSHHLECGKRFQGAIAVCDDTGVVIIEKENQTSELLARLELIEEQEDIWYDCVDRRKWSTFETICLKNYLKESSA